MKNSKYWQNRFKQLEAAQHATSAAEYAEVQKQFDKAYAAIQAKINAWYGRYADNNGISIEEARKQLSKAELKELKWDVREYIKYGKENAIDGRWMKELENASAKAHISRLEAIQLQTQQECEKLMGGVTDDIDEHLKRQYKNDYYHTAYEIQKGTGVGYSLAELNDDKLDNIIKKPWAADGKNFATRMGESKTTLINNIHNSLTQMCLLGENPQKAINQLAATMNGDKKRAGNIIMTESAFFSSEAQKQCFNDLDVEEFEIVATLDSHTDDECQKRDGVHKPMKFFEAGVTAPPFHPRCRCCTIPYFEDLGGERIARDEEGNSYYVPADTTYEQWKNGFIDSKKPTQFEPIKEPIVEYKKGKVDVLEDFKSNAKPKSGSIIYDKSFTYEGVTYDVDGINVKQHNNPHEIAVGKMLHNKFGGNIKFVPEVNGKYNYVKTPDYIWNDEKWDLKELNGKSSDAIRNSIKSKEKQSHNFIIDITNYQNDIDDVLKQCEIVFNASNTKFVEHLMIIKDMKVLHIFKRVQ